MACAWNPHVAIVDICKCSSNIEKGKLLSQLPAMQNRGSLKNGEASHSGKLFNQSTGETMKGQLFHFT